MPCSHTMRVGQSDGSVRCGDCGKPLKAGNSGARKIRLGRTAWGVLHALAQNNGRGLVSWGRRYPELSPGRAVVMYGAYHQVVAQGLVTSRGQNAPQTFALTARGAEAYRCGSIGAAPYNGPYLNPDTGEAFTGDLPTPAPHKWAREKDKIRSRSFG